LVRRSVYNRTSLAASAAASVLAVLQIHPARGAVGVLVRLGAVVAVARHRAYVLLAARLLEYRGRYSRGRRDAHLPRDGRDRCRHPGGRPLQRDGDCPCKHPGCGDCRSWSDHHLSGRYVQSVSQRQQERPHVPGHGCRRHTGRHRRPRRHRPFSLHYRDPM